VNDHPARNDEDALRRAEFQARAWARAGLDVQRKLREHAPHWPGDRALKVRLIMAALDGARRAGGHP
jgi:hypothetical protein